MSEFLRFRAVASGSLAIAAAEVVCSSPKSPTGPEEEISRPQIIVPSRGVFIMKHGAETLVADPGSALLLDERHVHRVEHPVDGGDVCVLLLPSLETLAEVMGDAGLLDRRASVPRFPIKRVGVSPRARLFLATLAAGDHEAGAEAALQALDLTVRDATGAGTRTPSPQARRRVERALEYLASAPGERRTLDDVARAAALSPFQLARAFRLVTGIGVHGYQTRLRLALAVDRLAGGEEDLTGLALDLGFSHHSHFTATFRGAFGLTPASVRKRLTRHGVERMRRISTARVVRPT